MARRVFFSFHYEDVKDFRANVVRNSWVMQKDREDAGFFDASLWENAKKKGDVVLKKLINDALFNTGVTCVLIGTETYKRRWVRYEIIRSLATDNGLLGVYIHNIKDKNQETAIKGPNPFDYLAIRYSATGNFMDFLEYKGSKWIKYADYDGYAVRGVSKQHWGKAYKLSQIKNVYDWVYKNGYQNFGSWIESAAKDVGR